MEMVKGFDEDILEGFAIVGNEGYQFPCPNCGAEVEVDDFGPAYRCDQCKCAVRFREENLSREESD